jgi:hypothetical protein
MLSSPISPSSLLFLATLPLLTLDSDWLGGADSAMLLSSFLLLLLLLALGTGFPPCLPSSSSSPSLSSRYIGEPARGSLSSILQYFSHTLSSLSTSYSISSSEVSMR